MSINITIKNHNREKYIPKKGQFTTWAERIILSENKNYEVVINVVDILRITELNKMYRNKNKPTNVLSFVFQTIPGISNNLLGDLVICSQIVRTEAIQQNKTIISHWAHLTVHGILHLLGHDHKTKFSAEKMEKLEISILSSLNIANPYKIL